MKANIFQNKLLIILFLVLSFFCISMLKPNESQAGTYYVSNQSDLKTYMETSSTDTIYLSASMTVTSEIQVTGTKTLYGQGYTLTYGVNTVAQTTIRVQSGGRLNVYNTTFVGDGTSGKYADECSTCLCANGGKLYVYNCTVRNCSRHLIHGEHISRNVYICFRLYSV